MNSKYLIKQRKCRIGTLAVFVAMFSLLLFSCKNRKHVEIAENEFYVCSMDPQVMEKQPGICPICKMPLTKAVIDKSQMHLIKINEEQAKLANIKVNAATYSFIGKGTSLTGVFTINQNTTEQISARIKGRIEQLHYKIIGSPVSKGDKLYDLYSRELLVAQEEYLLAIEKDKLLQINGQGLGEAARNKLLLWGLSETQVNELERTRQAKITNTIYSKVSGVITEIPLRDGDYVNEGTEVYKVADLHTVWVEAQLYTNELANLHEGEEVEIVPESYSDERIQGIVVFANPELQSQSKINLIRIEVANPTLKFKPGMQAYVTLKSKERRALALPVDAVIQNAGNAIIWVQTQKNTFEPRQVVTGVQSGNDIEILSGLNEGDSVVMSGTYLLNSEFIFKRGINPMEAMNHKNMKM